MRKVEADSHMDGATTNPQVSNDAWSLRLPT